MKIGFVLECTLKGPDAIIYPSVFSKLCGTVELEKPITLTNKKILMDEGHNYVEELMKQGCDYVFVIWDRIPKWGGTGRCVEEKESFIVKLQQLNIDETRVKLCCIDEMLESWLIADERGFNNWVSTLTQRALPSFSAPNQSDAENRIRNYFRENYSK